MSKLVEQAKVLLTEVKNERQKGILNALILQKKPEFSITALSALMFSFPVVEKKSFYIDYLALHFPEILCRTLLNPAKTRLRHDLRDALLVKLSINEKFARYFLNYYTLQKIEGGIKNLSSFNGLSLIPAKVRDSYSKENEKDRAKFFNDVLGGFGKSIVLFFFGYGFIYQSLYGCTDNEIATRLGSPKNTSKTAHKRGALSNPEEPGDIKSVQRTQNKSKDISRKGRSFSSSNSVPTATGTSPKPGASPGSQQSVSSTPATPAGSNSVPTATTGRSLRPSAPPGGQQSVSSTPAMPADSNSVPTATGRSPRPGASPGRQQNVSGTPATPPGSNSESTATSKSPILGASPGNSSSILSRTPVMPQHITSGVKTDSVNPTDDSSRLRADPDNWQHDLFGDVVLETIVVPDGQQGSSISVSDSHSDISSNQSGLTSVTPTEPLPVSFTTPVKLLNSREDRGSEFQASPYPEDQSGGIEFQASPYPASQSGGSEFQASPYSEDQSRGTGFEASPLTENLPANMSTSLSAVRRLTLMFAGDPENTGSPACEVAINGEIVGSLSTDSMIPKERELIPRVLLF